MQYDRDSVKQLRYGKLLLMTNLDYNGFQIKLSVIKFFRYLWPSLLEIPSFIFEFITPAVKATHEDGSVFTFDRVSEYLSWKASNDEYSSAWTIKNYEGVESLGAQDIKEFLTNLSKHQKDIGWDDDSSEEKKPDSDSDSDNEDSDAEVMPRKGGRDGVKKRIITEMLKPAEDCGISPAKKVRKLTESPFNSKSGSILGRVLNKESEEAGGNLEEMPAKATPSPKRTHVSLSDLELSEEDDDLSDSVFNVGADLSDWEEY